MNKIAEKFAPPVVVLGAAMYLGLPPSVPLDLGETMVKANAVRWKKEDLQPPVITRPTLNPFHEVLVAHDQMEVEPETGKLVVATKPAGPDPVSIRAGMTLSGIAQMGGRRWAVINGKPRLPGDALTTDDAKQIRCHLVSIGDNHVVVSSGETVVEIRPRSFSAFTSKNSAVSITPVSNSITLPLNTKPTDPPVSGEAVSPPPSFVPSFPTSAPPVTAPQA